MDQGLGKFFLFLAPLCIIVPSILGALYLAWSMLEHRRVLRQFLLLLSVVLLVLIVVTGAWLWRIASPAEPTPVAAKEYARVA